MSTARPRVPEWHGDNDLPSRAVTSTDGCDALLSLENFQRYRAQSAATRNNEVAQLPPRRELSKELDPA